MDEPNEYNLLTPFWIDTDGYTDRDREMFVCGVEFYMVTEDIETADGCACGRNIHRENESRIRMLCGKLGRKCRITPHAGYEGCETWATLEVADIGGEFEKR